MGLIWAFLKPRIQNTLKSWGNEIQPHLLLADLDGSYEVLIHENSLLP